MRSLCSPLNTPALAAARWDVGGSLGLAITAPNSGVAAILASSLW
jgi:hypothetical protein